MNTGGRGRGCMGDIEVGVQNPRVFKIGYIHRLEWKAAWPKQS